MSRINGSIGFALLLSFVFAAGAYGYDIDYNRLATQNLPYGEVIRITGNIKETTITVNKTDMKLSDIMKVKGVTLTYFANDSPAQTKPGSVSGDIWLVSLPTMKEKTSLTMSFNFTGSFSDEKAKEILDALVVDKTYANSAATLSKSEAESAEKQRDAATQFAAELSLLIPKIMKEKFPEITVGEPARQVLTKAVTDNSTAFYNLPPSEIKKKVENLKFAADEKIKADSVNNFKSNYDKLYTSLCHDGVIANYTTMAQGKDIPSQIDEYKKYFGVDVGALYMPSKDELRGFFTVNVYFGKVSDNPPNTDKSTKAGGYLECLRQRLSLTFGVSMGDISGRTSSDVKGNNAFICGLGFRVNKYVRITSGMYMYRSNTDDSLRPEFFVGPSIDFTAFDAIRNLFNTMTPFTP
jgi:hypothetical protein